MYCDVFWRRKEHFHRSSRVCLRSSDLKARLVLVETSRLRSMHEERCKCVLRAGETTQQLRSLAVLPEDMSSDPSTHVVDHIHMSLQL